MRWGRSPSGTGWTTRYAVFEERDELCWTVTGDEWGYPIETVAAGVRLSGGVQGLRANVFTGRYGEAGRAPETE
jgi:hypothetical protein